MAESAFLKKKKKKKDVGRTSFAEDLFGDAIAEGYSEIPEIPKKKKTETRVAELKKIPLGERRYETYEKTEPKKKKKKMSWEAAGKW